MFAADTIPSYVSTSYALGIASGLGLGLVVTAAVTHLLGAYLLLLALFHFFEFLFVAVHHPADVKWECRSTL
jgi:hypothetical protein